MREVMPEIERKYKPTWLMEIITIANNREGTKINYKWRKLCIKVNVTTKLTWVIIDGIMRGKKVRDTMRTVAMEDITRRGAPRGMMCTVVVGANMRQEAILRVGICQGTKCTKEGIIKAILTKNIVEFI